MRKKILFLFCFIFVVFAHVTQAYALSASDIISSVSVVDLFSLPGRTLEFNRDVLYKDAIDSYIKEAGTYNPVKYFDVWGTYKIKVILDSDKILNLPGSQGTINKIIVKKNVQFCGSQYLETTNASAVGFIFPDDIKCKDNLFFKGEPLEISVEITNSSGVINLSKSLYKFSILEKPLDASCKLEITADGQPSQLFYNTQKIGINGSGIDSGGRGFRVYIGSEAQKLRDCSKAGNSCGVQGAFADNNMLDGNISEFSLVKDLAVGEYKIEVKQVETNRTLCSKILPVNRAGTTPKPVSSITLIPTSVDEPGKSASSMQIEISSPGELCDSVPDNVNGKSVDYKARCQRCSAEKGIWTALGCFPTNVTDLAKTVFNLFSGLLGLFIFYCIISNGFKVMISRDSADAMKKAQEAITSCIVGLLVLVFSVLFLRIVGVDILKLPGWS